MSVASIHPETPTEEAPPPSVNYVCLRSETDATVPPGIDELRSVAFATVVFLPDSGSTARSEAGRPPLRLPGLPVVRAHMHAHSSPPHYSPLMLRVNIAMFFSLPSSRGGDAFCRPLIHYPLFDTTLLSPYQPVYLRPLYPSSPHCIPPFVVST